MSSSGRADKLMLEASTQVDLLDAPPLVLFPKRQWRQKPGEATPTNERTRTRTLRLPWHLGCEYQCRECHLLYFYAEDLRWHVLRRHGTSPDNYLAKHRVFETKADYVRCRSCDRNIKRSFDSCRNHVLSEHGLSLEEYAEKYYIEQEPRSYVVEECLLDPQLQVDGKAAKVDKEDDESQQDKRPVLVRPAILKKTVSTSSSSELAIKKHKAATSTSTIVVKASQHISSAWKSGIVAKKEDEEVPDVNLGDINDHERRRRRRPKRRRARESDEIPPPVEKVRVTLNRVVLEAAAASQECQRQSGDDNEKRAVKEESSTEDNIGADEMSSESESSCAADDSDDEGEDDDGEKEDNDNALVESLEVFLKGGCQYRCCICCTFLTHDSALFWDHVRAKHDKMDADSYRNAHGKPRVEETRLECPSCHKVFLHDPTSVRRHASEHGVSPEQYYWCLFRRKMTTAKKESDDEAFMDRFKKWCEYDYLDKGHAISKENYNNIKAHGPSKIKTKTTKDDVWHRCLLCQEVLLHSTESLSAHMKRSHDMELLQYYKSHELDKNPEAGLVRSKNYSCFSAHQLKEVSEWSSRCKFECKICRTNFTTTQSAHHHLKAIHNMSNKEYTKRFGPLMTEKVMHSCRICSTRCVHDNLSLAGHLRTHDLKLAKYYFAHVVVGKGKATEAPIMDLEERRMSDPKLLSEYLALESSSASSSSGPTVSVSGDPSIDWLNGCTYECSICRGRLTSLATFREHVEHLHQLEFEDYATRHGDPVVDAKLFTCALCAAVLTHDADEIAPHLASAHNGLTPEEYYYGQQGLTRTSGTGDEVALEETSSSNQEPAAPRSNKSNGGCRFQWNQCVSFCPSCPAKFFSDSAMYSHMTHKGLRASHAVGRVARYHHCKICNTSKKIKMNYKDILLHMKNEHQMSVASYEDAFKDSLLQEIKAASQQSDAAKHPGFDPDYCKAKIKSTCDL